MYGNASLMLSMSAIIFVLVEIFVGLAVFAWIFAVILRGT